MKWGAETIPQQTTLPQVLVGLLPVLAYEAVRKVLRRGRCVMRTTSW